MKTVDLTKDFDGPRDSCSCIESLSRFGIPYEYIDEDMIVFKDAEPDIEAVVKSFVET